MLRNSILLFVPLVLLGSIPAAAQPDTLYVPSGDTVYTYAIHYPPVETAEQYQMTGLYAFDTTRVAVRLDIKRGKPSGVYRAYYPDGKPLIFAVYGWGSLNGDWTEYDEFGRIAVKGQYEKGLRHGKWAFKQEGVFGTYKRGLKDGKWKFYDQQGRLTRTVWYRDDQLVK